MLHSAPRAVNLPYFRLDRKAIRETSALADLGAGVGDELARPFGKVRSTR